MKGLIYCVTFPNNKQYIGQTTQEIDVRIKQHQRSNKDTLISRAFKKYKTFTVNILFEIDDNDYQIICEYLDRYEILSIDRYETISPLGYNLSTGGGSGRKHNDESKEKMSKSHTGVPLSDFHKQQLGLAHIGISCKDDTKEFISNSNKQYSSDLPMYICKDKNNVIRVQIPGIPVKSFGSLQIQYSKRLELAINYYNKNIKQKNVQRLNVSG